MADVLCVLKRMPNVASGGDYSDVTQNPPTTSPPRPAESNPISVLPPVLQPLAADGGSVVVKTPLKLQFKKYILRLSCLYYAAVSLGDM